MKVSDFINLLKEHNLYLGSSAAVDHFNGDIHTDNRSLKQGDAFVCVKGFNIDGHSFVNDAILRGATLIIHEDELSCGVGSIRVKDSRKAAALACKIRYNDPSSKFCLIGITGTNGKTTVSQLLYQTLSLMGLNCGLIGTLGYYIGDAHYPTRHTTPDIVELNAIFNHMLSEGVTHVVMEVSSHAIALDRVYGLSYDYCLFTNLGRDHLDFHKDIEDYAATKARFFYDNPSSTSIINLQDRVGGEIYHSLKSRGSSVYSISEDSAEFILQNCSYTLTQSRYELLFENRILSAHTQLLGSYNVRNTAMVLAVSVLLKLNLEKVLSILATLKAPAGRFESVPNSRGIGVFVDYAHTPDAIDNVLRALADLPKRRVLCLIGAGGDRDSGKRPLMLKVAMQNSDAVIISNDNPRFEDPAEIIQGIIRDTDLWLPWWIIRDRKEAIHAILRLAQPGDLVVICGKGHETYQEIKNVRQHFDDREIAQAFLDQPNTRDTDALILPIDSMMLEILYNQNLDSNDYDNLIHYISHDTRSLKPASLYCAIKGENFDGHKYIPQALEDCSNYAISEQDIDMVDGKCFKVASSLESYGMICKKYLLMFSPYKVALTGSTGKTTCKEMIYQVLSQKGQTLKSEKNENNIIGLCKTILRIKPWHEFAVFELGTNHFGEIATLSEVCFPDLGMILNIGPSHLEAFIDEDGVFAEKSALFNRPLLQKIYPADDDRFREYRLSGISIGYSEDADYRISEVTSVGEKTHFKLNGDEYSIPYEMQYFALNAAYAIVTGYVLGFDRDSIRTALSSPVHLSQRMQIEKNGLHTLIIDCYNANPVSMLNAIEHWNSICPGQPHIAILGDMLELGSKSAMYHNMIAAVLIETNCDYLVTVGALAIHYQPQDAKVQTQHFENVQGLIESRIFQDWDPNSCILIKGSHGVHLELLVPHLRKGEL